MAPLLFITVINFYTAPKFVHYLGDDMYAVWGYVSLFTGIFGFADLGLGVAVGRYIGVALGKGDKNAVREYWGTGNLVAIPLLSLMGIVFMVVGVCFGPKYFNHLKPEDVKTLQWAFVCGGVGIFLSYYNQFWLVLSQAHLDFKFIGILRSCLQVLQILVSLWIAWRTGNPVLMLLSGIVLTTLQLVIFIWHARRKYDLGWHWREASMNRAREMAAYTAKSFAAMLANAFLGSIDRVLLGRLAPTSDFKTYTFCNNNGSRIQGLSMAVMGPVAFNTARAVGKDSREGSASIYNETFNFTFGWLVLISVWFACWHPVFLRLWLWRDDFYVQVTPVITPLVIAYCFNALANISTAQMGPLNRMGVELWFMIFRSLFLGACVVLGWHWGGLVGVAWGFLVSRIGVVAQDLYVIRLVGGGGWLSTRTWIHLALQCAAGLLFYLVASGLPDTSLWKMAIALAHGFLVAAWLGRTILRRMLNNFKPAVAAASPASLP